MAATFGDNAVRWHFFAWMDAQIIASRNGLYGDLLGGAACINALRGFRARERARL